MIIGYTTSNLRNVRDIPVHISHPLNNEHISHYSLRYSEQWIQFAHCYCATLNNEHVSRHLLHHLAQRTYFPPPTAPLGTTNIFPATYCATWHNKHVYHHLLRHLAQ